MRQNGYSVVENTFHGFELLLLSAVVLFTECKRAVFIRGKSL